MFKSGFNFADPLIHIYWFKSEVYKQYYRDRITSSRFIIADNGLFEGDLFTEQQLIDFVNELQPNIFVIPDAILK